MNNIKIPTGDPDNGSVINSLHNKYYLYNNYEDLKKI